MGEGGRRLYRHLSPLDGRVVHLVDDDDEHAYAQGLGQQGVLASLAAAAKERKGRRRGERSEERRGRR